MAKKVGIFILFFLSTFPAGMIFRPVTLSWAETSSNLLEMNSFEKKGMTRIFLVFDRIPEFDIENSGQRVRILFSRTSFEPSFNRLAQGEAVFMVKTDTRPDKSVLDLYFRSLPKYVDFTIDEEDVSLLVNIFWHEDNISSRPGITNRMHGEYKSEEGGITAKKIISSKYRGRWIDFFEEFEYPVQMTFPINFSFPSFPSPFFEQNSAVLKEKPLRSKTENLPELGESATEIANEDGQEGESCLYDLALAESLIREKKYNDALGVLDRIGMDPKDETNRGWQEYFRSYAKASTGNYFYSSEIFGRAEKFLKADALAPWFRLFQIELELAKENPETALNIIESQFDFGGTFSKILELRKADALYQSGRLDQAYEFYQKAATELDFFRRHAYSLSNWAGLLYQRKEFVAAAKYYLLLSETLEDRSPDQKALAQFLSAMASLRANDEARARLLFSLVNDENPGKTAGLRSWLKLIDLDVLEDAKPPLDRLLYEYDEIVNLSSGRTVREEAFFKKILACHLFGDDLQAVKFLGRFFDEYWAGHLISEAQALLVEIFPSMVENLIQSEESFLALALVAKHRELLAQACITYDFLHSLAEHYHNAGFLEQAEKTYLFMLDFEKETEKKNAIYLPLIRICYQQKKYGQCEKYAETYLNKSPEDEEKAQVLYYYTDVLYRMGEIERAAKILLEKKRPVTKALDQLAGDLFFDLGSYDLVEYFLSRAEERGAKDPGIILKRAEAFYHDQKWQKAVPLYEWLLENSQFAGQAGYRLIQMFVGMGKNQVALNVFNKVTEKQIDKHWIDLSDQIVRTGNYF